MSEEFQRDFGQHSPMCDTLEPYLAAYVLGERAAIGEPLVAAHLRACARCQAALARIQGTAGLLPLGVPDAVPAPELRAKVIAAVTAAANGVPPTRRHTRLRWRLDRHWLWRAGSVALLVCLLLWNLTLHRRLDTQTAQIAASRENWQDVTLLFTDPDVRGITLGGDVAIGTLWTSPHAVVACLMAQHLPSPGQDQVYQIWLIRAGVPVAAGTFVPYGQEAWKVLRTDEPANAFEYLVVTVEPRGGSPAPTGPRVLEGSLAASATAAKQSLVGGESRPR